MNNLHDSVERWLVQDGYPVTETKSEDNFKIIIKNIDAFSNNLEIFEPKTAGQCTSNWCKDSAER